MKVWNLCKMMHERGHEVIHMGTEGSKPICTEHVDVGPAKMWQELYGARGQIVLDPFCGSGSTLVAAKLSDRQYLGFEVDPDSVNIANERLQPDIFEMAMRRKKAG